MDLGGYMGSDGDRANAVEDEGGTEEDSEEDEGGEIESDMEVEGDGSRRTGQAEPDDEGQQFDITLPATHSYMGSELEPLPGRAVLESGAVLELPALSHHGAVFPGETVPMLLMHERDVTLMRQTIAQDKMFALLCPDESCTALCGYGVVCEVFEAARGAAQERGVSFKARAVYRCRLRRLYKRPPRVYSFVRLQYVEVVILPEVSSALELGHARLAALDPWRRPRPASLPRDATLRRMDAALGAWPAFVYEMFEYTRLRDRVRAYFQRLGGGGGIERLLPSEPVPLSFWVASNLTAPARERVAMLAADNALVRLRIACRLIARKSVLCCVTCGTEIALREHATSMSSEGLHANYTNPGGFVHDVVTVSRARNTRPAGPPSTEFSWFPGYSWTVRLCSYCSQHVGWRFKALQPALRPRSFFALCRNYVGLEERPPREPAPDPAPLHALPDGTE